MLSSRSLVTQLRARYEHSDANVDVDVDVDVEEDGALKCTVTSLRVEIICTKRRIMPTPTSSSGRVEHVAAFCLCDTSQLVGWRPTVARRSARQVG